jgi:hypothetical protein
MIPKNKDGFEADNLAIHINLRIFADMNEEIERIMKLSCNYDKWDNKSHYIRAAVMKFNEQFKTKRS